MRVFVFKTNSQRNWDYQVFWNPRRGWDVTFGDVENGGGKAIGLAGWQARIRRLDEAWWYDTPTGLVYAWQVLAGGVEPDWNAIPAIRGECVNPPVRVRIPTGASYRSWHDLGLPSLAPARMTVLELTAQEQPRWRRLVNS
jgi:hypothetical protein